MVLLPVIWYILYLDLYRALSSAALLSVDNVSHWLCYARAYTDWSQKVAFYQLHVLSTPAFFHIFECGLYGGPFDPFLF